MAFRAHQKVRFGDVDHAGIVYYPRFVHYFHVAMEEFFSEALGVDYPQVLERERFGLPTVHLEVDFRRPLRYGDAIEVAVEVEAIGRTSVTWRYRVFRPGEADAVAEARAVTAGIDMDSFRPRPVPDWFRQAVARLQGAAGGLDPS
jgi:4-hydroxybenzoyl-CoA thioesterase